MDDLDQIIGKLSEAEREALFMMPMRNAGSHPMWDQFSALFNMGLALIYQVEATATCEVLERGMKPSELGLAVRQRLLEVQNG